MKKFTLLLFSFIVLTYSTEGQIKLKKKAEKKANQVIDDFLFGKKKKKEEESTPVPPGTTTPTQGTTSSNDSDTYIPEEVDFESIDMAKSIHFNTLINMLPEKTQGFSRKGKPEGSRFNTQGISYSTGVKQYRNEDREMTISLNDYLGAEYFASAQTAQQYEYESTEGYSKSIEIDGMTGWISYDNSSKEGNLMLFKDNRFFATINIENTSESELRGVANDLNLSRLK